MEICLIWADREEVLFICGVSYSAILLWIYTVALESFQYQSIEMKICDCQIYIIKNKERGRDKQKKEKSANFGIHLVHCVFSVPSRMFTMQLVYM